MFCIYNGRFQIELQNVSEKISLNFVTLFLDGVKSVSSPYSVSGGDDATFVLSGVAFKSLILVVSVQGRRNRGRKGSLGPLNYFQQSESALFTNEKVPFLTILNLL